VAGAGNALEDGGDIVAAGPRSPLDEMHPAIRITKASRIPQAGISRM
jgi:hypothetical protein